MRHRNLNGRIIFPALLIAAIPALMGQTCGVNFNGNQNQNSNSNNNENNNSSDDNARRIYGDGSAGAKVVSSDENWNTPENRQTNLQFTDLTIEEGVTLIIPSGMTIRCKGTFTNLGTVFVRQAAEGGFSGLDDPAGPDFAFTPTPAAIGIATGPASLGESGDSTAALRGGKGGEGLSEFESRVVLLPGTKAGGGGAGGGMDTNTAGVSVREGADGGGSVVFLVRDEIVNMGEILAEGQDANVPDANDLGGGGGGGVIVLASTRSIDNAGVISANGGTGEDADSNNAPSGGGGGGIIQLYAPAITNTGEMTADGGAGGANTSPVTDNAMRYAGGGGGASAGKGGKGGSVPAGAGPIQAGDAGAGASGFVFENEQDPTNLF